MILDNPCRAPLSVQPPRFLSIYPTMQCYIYRSPRKADAYLYLAQKDDFDAVPAELMRVFGPPEFCFDFELTSERRLAQEEAVEVLRNLETRGFHLQMATPSGEPF